jgi:hypothetical protein
LGFLAIIIIMLLRLLMAILPLRQWFVLILIVFERLLNCRHHSVSAATPTDVAATSGG